MVMVVPPNLVAEVERRGQRALVELLLDALHRRVPVAAGEDAHHARGLRRAALRVEAHGREVGAGEGRSTAAGIGRDLALEAAAGALKVLRDADAVVEAEAVHLGAGVVRVTIQRVGLNLVARRVLGALLRLRQQRRRLRRALRGVPAARRRRRVARFGRRHGDRGSCVGRNRRFGDGGGRCAVAGGDGEERREREGEDGGVRGHDPSPGEKLARERAWGRSASGGGGGAPWAPGPRRARRSPPRTASRSCSRGTTARALGLQSPPRSWSTARSRNVLRAETAEARGRGTGGA